MSSLLNVNKSCLLLIDVQEKLVPTLTAPEQLVENCKWMLKVANKLNIPVLVSEQYSKGLGYTVAELSKFFKPEQVMDKLHFSCAADPDCLARINALQREQIVLIGMETQVCVLETAFELQALGKQVFIVIDAVGSRRDDEKQYAIDRMRSAGMSIISKEMALCEWIRKAGTDLFKELSKEFLR